MSSKPKYNLNLLDWQQFEVLSFKCLQFDISPSIQLVEGGNDKGRDILYTGTTSFFDSPPAQNSFVFQIKHKSNLESFSTLKNELKYELEKVYLKNKFTYQVYCIVTNLLFSGNQIDELNAVFETFISENNIGDVRFRMYGYRHFESCIDRNPTIKWDFPSVISVSDLKFLLSSLLATTAKTTSEGWLKVFEKNRHRFIYSGVFEIALKKLKENKILLLSGPPKAGKTFNAEMILLNKFGYEGFIPYKINSPEDFEEFYNLDEKQIFLFDDAFGKHDIELYRADIFNRKLEFIFELIDTNHNCIFTSREYIFKAFSNYADIETEKIINRVNVEVSQFTLAEKESLFRRYFVNAFPSGAMLEDHDLDEVVSHKNFSPETIRSYFDTNKSFNLADFKSHLHLPDKYLEKVFNNLSEQKRIILLSILLSLKGDEVTICYSFSNICQDIGNQYLIALKNELIQLDGSIIRNTSDVYDFYHPSMRDFFIDFLSKDIAVYRNLLFRNLNLEILTISRFQPSKREKNLEIKTTDVNHLKIGFARLIMNQSVTVFELNSLFTWLNDTDVQLNLKVKLKSDYKDLMSVMYDSLCKLDYNRFLHESIALIADFFNNINLFLTSTERERFIDITFLKKLVTKWRDHDDFWLLVFKMAPLVGDNFIYDFVGRDWLNAFYSQLKADINLLGKELYGNAYPDFTEWNSYKKHLAEKNYEEARKIKKKARADYMQRTSNDWFPKYRVCKRKMSVAKSCPTFGYVIYERLAAVFGHLVVLEDQQKNRYLFNIQNNWWK